MDRGSKGNHNFWADIKTNSTDQDFSGYDSPIDVNIIMEDSEPTDMFEVDHVDVKNESGNQDNEEFDIMNNINEMLVDENSYFSEIIDETHELSGDEDASEPARHTTNYVQELAMWSLNSNCTNQSLNDLLKILHKYCKHHYLPRNVDNLLQSIREKLGRLVSIPLLGSEQVKSVKRKRSPSPEFDAENECYESSLVSISPLPGYSGYEDNQETIPIFNEKSAHSIVDNSYSYSMATLPAPVTVSSLGDIVRILQTVMEKLCALEDRLTLIENKMEVFLKKQTETKIAVKMVGVKLDSTFGSTAIDFDDFPIFDDIVLRKVETRLSMDMMYKSKLISEVKRRTDRTVPEVVNFFFTFDFLSLWNYSGTYERRCFSELDLCEVIRNICADKHNFTTDLRRTLNNTRSRIKSKRQRFKKKTKLQQEVSKDIEVVDD